MNIRLSSSVSTFSHVLYCQKFPWRRARREVYQYFEIKICIDRLLGTSFQFSVSTVGILVAPWNAQPSPCKQSTENLCVHLTLTWMDIQQPKKTTTPTPRLKNKTSLSPLTNVSPATLRRPSSLPHCPFHPPRRLSVAPHETPPICLQTVENPLPSCSRLRRAIVAGVRPSPPPSTATCPCTHASTVFEACPRRKSCQ